MYKELNIAHWKPVSFKPLAEGEMFSPSDHKAHIERIVFDPVRYDEFVHSFWKQREFLQFKGYEPDCIIVDIQDYKNLMTYQQLYYIETFNGYRVVLDKFTDKSPKVLPSPKDQIALAFFISQEEEGR